MNSVKHDLMRKMVNRTISTLLMIILLAPSLTSPADAAQVKVYSCSLTWTAEILVEDNGTQPEPLTIGQGTATDGVDADCGESRLPPKPPTGAFDARLILPGGVDASKTDIRSSLQSDLEWRIEFQPGSGGYPFEFSWNPANLPAGTWLLRDLLNVVVNVDMKSQSSYTLNNDNVDTLIIEFETSIPQRQLFLPLVISG